MVSKEMYNLTRLLKKEVNTNKIIDEYRFFFQRIVREMALSDDAKFKNYLLFLKRSLTVFNERPEIELQIFGTIVNEYIHILQIYLKENISSLTLERMAKNHYSFPILESARNNSFNYNELKDILVKDTDNKEEVLNFQRSFNSVLSLRLIQKTDENTYTISQKGENIYTSYETSKKLTNKYERTRRKQLNLKVVKIDVELLNQLGDKKDTFKVLKTMKESDKRETLVSETLVEKTGVNEIEPIIRDLMNLTLIRQRFDNAYVMTERGRNIFRMYKKSKRYTNKYENLKRKN